MFAPPVAFTACCAAAALAKVAANPPFLGAGAATGVDGLLVLGPVAGFAAVFRTGRGLMGLAAIAVRAVPLYSVAVAGAGLAVLVVSVPVGCTVREIAGFDSVLNVFGLAPASPSSAFLFNVGALDAPGCFAAFATIVGLGFGTVEAFAGDLDTGTGVFAADPSLPTDASSAANWTDRISSLSWWGFLGRHDIPTCWKFERSRCCLRAMGSA